MAAADRAARVEELLSHIGLWDRRKELVNTWSLGMRKKLALARAMLHRPPVLFLDEPTTGLDPVARAALRTDIVSLAEKNGATVFLTTHDLDDAQRMCTLVGVMRAGRLIATGSLDDLSAEYLSADVEIRGHELDRSLDAVRRHAGVISVEGDEAAMKIRLKKGASVAPHVRLAVRGGAQIEEVRPEHSSLEDAFLAIVGETKA
jgi:ABC-2 type transport system ATP-binding protein